MSPSPRAATTREGQYEARNLVRLSRSMTSLPPGRRTRTIPSSTARLVVSSKYPNAVDQLITRSKRPVHGIWRMSPATYSTLTPAAAASARARSRKTAEESRPVTRQSRAAKRLASSPCPQARSSTRRRSRARGVLEAEVLVDEDGHGLPDQGPLGQAPLLPPGGTEVVQDHRTNLE